MSSISDFTETVNVSFHDVAYLLTVSTINGDTLCLEVEQKSDASRWRGDFTASHIEDISTKIGNYKKFPVFVKMLLSALKQASDSVFVDLLTYKDLRELTQRKAGIQPAAAMALTPNNKRYLILTYAAEFDRVHYPLPLSYDENPDPQHLRHIISQLRAEVEALQLEGGGGRRAHDASTELRRLREENGALRQQLKQLDRYVRADLPDSERLSVEAKELARELKLVRKERDLLQARMENMDAEVERERGLHRRELRRKAKEMQEVQDQLAAANNQIRELKIQVRQLMDELDAVHRRTTSTDRVRSAYRPDPRPNSRPSSGRGTSPSSHNHAPVPPAARSNSRGRETSSRERSQRPSSAPSTSSRHRFDPTAYIQQKKDREKQLADSRNRYPTPPRSVASSGRSTPIASRPTSAEQSRGPSPYISRPNSRPVSTERQRPRPTSTDRARPTNIDTQPRSRGSSPGSTSSARRPAAAWGDRDGWSKFPPVGQGRSQAPAAAASPVERSTSPGKALQEVKRKLSEFVQKRNPDDNQDKMSQASQQTSKSEIFNDASAEIADIDSRLHALQNFLKMAKGGSSTAGSVISNGT